MTNQDLIKWLDDSCTEHSHNKYPNGYTHRKDCPWCWKSIAKEYGIIPLIEITIEEVLC